MTHTVSPIFLCRGGEPVTGKVKLFLTVLRSAYYVLKLAVRFLLAWLTLGWRVRKARKAFEAEVTREGISEAAARRLSGCYSDLKDQFSLRSMVSYFRERRRTPEP